MTMEITAALVKELRERTGSGMMECKKALMEAAGDIEAAIDLMRTKGALKAGAKASRIAADGMVMIAQNSSAIAIVEVNSETDFVAKGEAFQAFVKAVVEQALASQPATLEALLATPIAAGESDIETQRKELIAKLGENINVRRFAVISSQNTLVSYTHGSNSRIAVIVELSGGNEALARDIAMHIAAMKPVCVNEDQVPAELIAKEKAIFTAQSAESGKPADIIEKMVVGRLKKYLKEVTLLGQPFVKDNEKTIEQLLKAANAQVKQFIRFEVGEGIEKKVENFAEAVMAQAKGN